MTLRVRFDRDSSVPLWQVWLVDGEPLAASKFAGHPDADYIGGFLTEAARDSWVQQHGFEVVT